MARPKASPFPSAEVVANVFVEQYYHILHHSPNLVHRFYQDSSLLSRPDANGVMTTVTNMQASMHLYLCVHGVYSCVVIWYSTHFKPFCLVREF